jgi:hypothetical protein
MEIAPVCRLNPLPCLVLCLSAENASAMSDRIPKQHDPISGSPDQVPMSAGKAARSYSSVASTSQIRDGRRVACSITKRTLWFIPPSDRPNMPGGDAERSGPRADQSFLNHDLTGLRMVEQARPAPGRSPERSAGTVRTGGNAGAGEEKEPGEAPAGYGKKPERSAGRLRGAPEEESIRGTRGRGPRQRVVRTPAWRGRWRVVRWSCREARRAEVASMRQVGARRG